MRAIDELGGSAHAQIGWADGLLVCFGTIGAAAQSSETTGTIRVRIAAPLALASTVRLDITASDDPAFSRSGELHDAGQSVQFPRNLPGVYRLTAALQGFRDAEATFYLAPGTLAEVVIEFCDPAAICIASTTRVVHTDSLGHGYTFDRVALESLPGNDAVASVVETSVAQLIVDRMSSGGLWGGEAALISGSGSSWRQSSVRLGDVDVTDPVRIGTALARSDRQAFESLLVHTAMLPASLDGPGPILTLIPKLPSRQWHGAVSSAVAPPPLQSSNSLVGVPSIARFANHHEWSAQLQGPVARRGGIFLSVHRVLTDRAERADPARLHSAIGSLFANSAIDTGDRSRVRITGNIDRVSVPYPGRARLPNRTVDEHDTFGTTQVVWDYWTTAGSAWSAASAFERGNIAPELNLPRNSDLRTGVAVVDRLRDGPVPSLFDVFPATRQRIVGRIDGEPAWPLRRHSLAMGGSVSLNSATTRFGASPPVAETVDGIPARLWEFQSSGSASRWASNTTTGYIEDRVLLPYRLRANAGARIESLRGTARGGLTPVKWLSWSPRLSLRWTAGSSDRFEVFGGQARYMHNLPLDDLAFGDPSALTGQVYRWEDPDGNHAYQADERGVLVAAVGACCAGGIPNRIDALLRRPHTDERVAGVNVRLGTWSLRMVGVERRERDLIASVNTGVTSNDYIALHVADAGEQFVEAADDRLLVVYDRKVSSFGRDQYFLTNPEGNNGYYKGFEVTLEGKMGDLARTRFDGSAYHGATLGSNRGFGAAENDPGVIGELFENPNATTYARGHAFSDRGYVMKWWGQYVAPQQYLVSAAARYQDGQAFSRFAVVEGLNQGPEPISAYRRGRTRFTFTFSLDARLQKSFRIGKAVVTGTLTLFNALNTGEEIEESIVTSELFRTPTSIQPPRATHIGMRIEF